MNIDEIVKLDIERLIRPISESLYDECDRNKCNEPCYKKQQCLNRAVLVYHLSLLVKLN